MSYNVGRVMSMQRNSSEIRYVPSKGTKSLFAGQRVTSDMMPWVFVGHTAINAPCMHAHRGFIHPVVVDYLTLKHCSATFPFPKIRSFITPEIRTVGDYSSRERILRPDRTRSIPKTIPCCGKEGINPKEGRPLLNTAMSSTALCKSRVWSLPGRGKASSIH